MAVIQLQILFLLQAALILVRPSHLLYPIVQLTEDFLDKLDSNPYYYYRYMRLNDEPRICHSDDAIYCPLING